MSDPIVTGIVHLIEPTKTFGQKGFRKRLVVIEQNSGRFTNYLPMEFLQDACDQADSLNVGDRINVSYRLTGRKWQRDPQSEVKFFLSAEVLSMQRLEGASATAPGPDEPPPGHFDDDDSAPF